MTMRYIKRNIRNAEFTPFESPVSAVCDNEVTPSPYVYNSRMGFTLVELMVSLTVFSIVMLISVGTLLTLIDANAKAQALYMATTNLSFALDVMTRDIRTSHYYRAETVNSGNHYGQDNNAIFGAGSTKTGDGSQKNGIAFTRDWSDVRVCYRLKDFEIQQAVGSCHTDTSWVSLTSANTVIITELNFTVQNSSVGGGQPTIAVSIQGEVADGIEDDSTTDFDIQTQIISRRLDII